MKKKKKRRLKKMRKRLRGRSKHHIIPKCRGGKSTPDNLLLLKIERHRCWHEIFGTLTIEEAIELLKRIAQAKKRQGGE